MKTSVLIIISIVAIFFLGWLAFQTIGSGAVVVISIILGIGLVRGLFNIPGTPPAEPKIKSSSNSNRKYKSTQETVDLALNYGEKEAARRRRAGQ